jgi:hypothetical protein
VHDAPFDLDHEQRVVAPKEDRVDGEEVGGDDAGGLCAEELDPAGPSSPRCGGKGMDSKDVGDAALGHPDTELLQLPDDA